MANFPPLSDELALQAVALVMKHGSISKASHATGLKRRTLGGRVKIARERFPGCLPESRQSHDWGASTDEKPRVRAKAWRGPDENPWENRRAAHRGEVGGPPIPPIAKPPEGFVISRNSGEYDEAGNLRRQWIESRRDNGETFTVPAGHVVKGESALVDPEGRVIAKWVKTREGAGEGLVEALQSAFESYRDTGPIVPSPAYCDDHGLTLYPLPDLHFGQYSWKVETGASYDVDIAASVAITAIDSLLGQSRPTKHATILGLGDYLHVNDQTNATPAHKNRLDADTRFARVLALGARLATQIVDRVARRHEEVEVVFLPGNHDPEAALALAISLSLFYSQNPRIKVRMDPSLVWCRRFGRSLLAATHGHTMKAPRFRSFLTARHAQDWGLTAFRYGFMGHIHHETADEEGGIRIESFQTPAAPDAHASGSGYVAGRSLSAITFDAERGEVGRHRVNIEPPAYREQWTPFQELSA
jgi:hypothetical protein